MVKVTHNTDYETGEVLTKQRTTNPIVIEMITLDKPSTDELMEEAKQLLISLMDVICLRNLLVTHKF